MTWVFDAGAAAERQAAERILVQAWWTEAFHRQKTLKPLKSLLDRVRAAGHRQTPNEQRTMLETLAVQYGLTLRKGTRT